MTCLYIPDFNYKRDEKKQQKQTLSPLYKITKFFSVLSLAELSAKWFRINFSNEIIL